ncbi:uncharacterized protein LOC128891697 isoform X4 [Hylaeus anthracinus]|uniref:uncharacterized protein LOC128891697 isoform X4 n=1 Tax=Hylaeus anthracinus TaxID=313031 RepID=UPI0023B99CD2|nr:uncharacterized protein LOC128891697 isoform X4 [Hylaeus anthracinus]
MALLERNTSVNPLTRKDLVRNIKARVKPFDVETTFVELNAEKKNRGKKYRGPDSPLYSAIYPLVCIMKVFGLAPYDFAGDRMTVSNICLVLSLAFLVLYSYIIYMVYLRFIDTKRDKSIVAVVETVKVIVNYLVAMYELVSTVFSRRSFLRIWNALQDLDERLASLGYPLKETKTKIAVWALLVIQTVVWTIINLSGIYAYSEKWSFNVSYMCIYLGTTMSVYKFAGMTFFVGQRFHQLNRMARENLPPKIGYKSTTISRKANSMGAIVLEWDARVIKRFPHDDSVRTSLHFLNRRLRFNAGGLFDINLPLLCSIVGVLSTYLVILLQFPA